MFPHIQTAALGKCSKAQVCETSCSEYTPGLPESASYSSSQSMAEPYDALIQLCWSWFQLLPITSEYASSSVFGKFFRANRTSLRICFFTEQLAWFSDFEST